MREPVAPGDFALLPRGCADDGLLGHVFRIEEDYVLVSAPANRVVELNQRLYIRRAGQCVGQLEVQTLQRTFIGARPLDDDQDIALWDEVSIYPPARWPRQWSPWRVSAVVGGQAIGLKIAPAAREAPAAGTLLALRNEQKTLAVGLVLESSPDAVVVWAPRCWQDGPLLPEMLICASELERNTNAESQGD
jgi:hypothetical protein